MRSSRSSRVLASRTSSALRPKNAARRFLPLSCGVLLAGGMLAQIGAARAAEEPAGEAVRAARLLLAQLPSVVQSDEQNGPIVTVLQPGYSDVLRGNAAIVVGIQARRYSANTIELLVDGKSASNGAVPISAGASLSFNWKTSDFTDGPHRLTVRVTDTQGFRSDAEVRVYINNGRAADVTPPTLSWLNVRSGDVLRGEKNLQLQASDNFGVKYVWVSVKSTLDPSKPLKMWMVNRAPFAFTLNSDRLPDGLYTLEAMAWDALENEGRAQKITFGIANNTLNPTWMQQLDAARTSAKTSDAFAPAVQSKTPRAATSAKASRLIVPNTKSAASTRAQRLAEGMTRPETLSATSEGAAMTGIFNELGSAPSRPNSAARSASEKRALLASMPKDARHAASTRAASAAAARDENARVSVVETRGDATTSRTKPASTRSITQSVATLPRDEKYLAMAPVNAAQNDSVGTTFSADASASQTARIAAQTPRSSGQARIGELDFLGARSEEIAPATFGDAAQTASNERFAPSQVSSGAPVAAPRADTGVARLSMPRVAAMPDFDKPQRRGARAASITVMPLGKAIPAFHSAKIGETLDTVAARYGVSRELLAAVNPEAKSRVLAAGEKLRLPRLLQVRYAGAPVSGDVSAMMVGSTGVTPFRFLFEKQGGTMTWDAAKQRVVARTSDQEVTVTIGSKAAVVNRRQVTMDLAAFLLSGRTMVPVRFFEKALHAQIEWEPSTGRLFVAMNNETNAKKAPIKRG